MFPISVENVCLRGARLKKTSWAVGIVVYAGMESKLAKNSSAARTKFSTMDKTLNFCIAMLFVFLTILSLALMGGSYAVAPSTNNYFYLQNASQSSQNLFLNFFTNLMLLNTFIPLSLMVTLEVSIFLQSFFMQWDDDLWSEERGNMRVRRERQEPGFDVRVGVDF
mmetsp:Transcript_36785/g.114994  ORF Transcript_36785/g.114994 Transcript_36785/m.114994 type:complete len:166 (-) Transcript_36785:8-505(-)